MNSRHIRLFCLVLLFANIGCASGNPQKFRTLTLSIERAGAEPVEIAAEVAITDAERSQGLMNRKKLPDGEGMLFVFEHDQQVSFWMKDTLIPLSIAFIASDGRITEIRDLQPKDLSSVNSNSTAIRYALEVAQGWFGRVGVRPGDMARIDLAGIDRK